MRQAGWLIIAGATLGCVPDAVLGEQTGGSGGTTSTAGAGGVGGQGGDQTGGGGEGGTDPCMAESGDGPVLSAAWGYPAQGEQRALAVASDDNGGFAVGIWSAGAEIDLNGATEVGHAVAANFDSNGMPRFTVGGVSSTMAAGVEALAFRGSVLFVGTTYGGTLLGGGDITASGSLDPIDSEMLVHAHDNVGNEILRADLDHTGLDRTQSLAALPDGRIAVCGAFSNNLNAFPNQNLPSGQDPTHFASFVGVYDPNLAPECGYGNGVITPPMLPEVLTLPSCRLAADPVTGELHAVINYNVSALNGQLPLTPDDGFDFLALRINPNDCSTNVLTSFEGSKDDAATAIAVRHINNVGETAIAGRYDEDLTLGGLPAGNDDAFIAKLGIGQIVSWAKPITSSGEAEVTGLAFDSTGNIIVVGFYQDTLTIDDRTLPLVGFEAGFVGKLTPNGAVVWLRSLHGEVGSGDNVRPRAVSVGPGDVITIAGSFDGTVCADIGNLSANDGDAFVVRLPSN